MTNRSFHQIRPWTWGLAVINPNSIDHARVGAEKGFPAPEIVKPFPHGEVVVGRGGGKGDQGDRLFRRDFQLPPPSLVGLPARIEVADVQEAL